MTVEGSPGMPARELSHWAKETLLGVIDKGLGGHPDAYGWDADDDAALLKQRNRVARALGLPVIGLRELLAARSASV